MGQGTDLARQAGGGLAAEVIEDLKEQLLLVFIKRLGGKVTVPVQEVDDTGGQVLMMEIVGSDFVFEIQQKQ